MTTLFTNFEFVTLTIGEFNLYGHIKAAAGDATAVHLGMGDSGSIDFALKLGATSAEIIGSVGNDTVIAGAGADTLSGGESNDALYGGTDIDNLSGGTGDDQLFGGNGSDILNGDAGADLMAGGLGHDLYFADDSHDIVLEDLDGGRDTVVVTATRFSLGANVENLTAAGSGRFLGHGNDLDNEIRGGSGRDLLYGNGGNDTIFGSADDVLIGGAGNDTYYVTDANSPSIVESSKGGIDTLYSDRDINSPIAGVENFTTTATDNARLTGNDLDNVLTGNQFANTFFGGAGNDTMTGGESIDMFIFYDADSVDTITDFKSSDDTIILISTAFAGMKEDGGPISEDEFKVTSLQKEDASDRILYDQRHGLLSYDADGLGGVDAVLVAILQHRPFLTHFDIEISM